MYSYPAIVALAGVGDAELDGFIDRLQGNEISNECIDGLLHNCLSWYPCNPETDLPLFICEESCIIYKQIIAAGFCQDIGDFIAMISDNQVLAMNFNCAASIYLKYDPDTCTNCSHLKFKVRQSILMHINPLVQNSHSIVTARIFLEILDGVEIATAYNNHGKFWGPKETHISLVK